MKIHRPDTRLAPGLSAAHRVLLSSTAIIDVNVAEIIFTLSPLYNYFEILIRDLRCTSDDVSVAIAVGNAITDIIISNDYNWANWRSSLAGATLESVVGDNSIKLVQSAIGEGVGNAEGEGFNAEIFLNNPHRITNFFSLQAKTVIVNATNGSVSHSFVNGTLNLAQPIDRVSITFTAGNFSSGVIQHYGITGGV